MNKQSTSSVPAGWVPYVLDTSSTFRFGRHKGQTVQSVLDLEKGWEYLLNLERHGWVSLNPSLFKAVKYKKNQFFEHRESRMQTLLDLVKSLWPSTKNVKPGESITLQLQA